MEQGQKLFVRSGTKRRLRRLRDVEVEVVSVEDNSAFVKCRRCDDGKFLKLKKNQLVTGGAMEHSEEGGGGGLREEEQQAILKYQRELLDLEDLIPWNCVTPAWKTKRNPWRKRITESRTLQDIGEGVKDLLRYLLWGREQRLVHSPFLWGVEIDEICSDNANCEAFDALWKRLSLEIQRWIHAHTKQHPSGMHFVSPELSQRTARLALQTLKSAVVKGEDALRQVPLADILHHDPEALKRLKDLLIQEKGKQNSSVAAMNSIKKQKPEHC
eukprot:g4921.t1